MYRLSHLLFGVSVLSMAAAYPVHGNETSSTDQIVVDKQSSDDPGRFDVIVFKNLTEPRTNYIKRLRSLPGEPITWDDFGDQQSPELFDTIDAQGATIEIKLDGIRIQGGRVTIRRSAGRN